MTCECPVCEHQRQLPSVVLRSIQAYKNAEDIFIAQMYAQKARELIEVFLEGWN